MDVPDQSGRTFVVTGANSGLGLETARALVGAGGHVALAVRDVARGEDAAAEVAGAGTTEVRELDLADLASVRKFAADWDGPIHALVNNAGIMMVPQGRTADGFERQLGTNHLGHFALTNLLLPQVTDRVVTVSSSLHRGQQLDFDDLDLEHGYQPTRAYQQSKLANLLFTSELQRRLTAAGSAVTANAAHPGYSATNLQSHHASRLMRRAMWLGNKLFATSAAFGARPTVHAVVADLPGDTYVGPTRFGGSRGAPGPVGRSAEARDEGAARRLWESPRSAPASCGPCDAWVAISHQDGRCSPPDLPFPVWSARTFALMGRVSRTPYSRASSAGRRQRVLTLLPLALLSSAVTVHLAAPGPAAVTAAPSSPTDPAPRTPFLASPPMTPASVSTHLASEASPTGVVPTVATADVQGIPAPALAAYQRAETVINAADESCNLSWQLLAAIGEVESHHGRFGVSQLSSEGEAVPAIIGVPLTGAGGTALVRDTDAGVLDGDQDFDRAVGPMQFIPSTWSVVGVDSDNDGERNPQDIDDAALAAAVYLCSGDDDLSTPSGQVVAVNRYNHSAAYVERVLNLMQQYLAGGFTSGPAGVPAPVTTTTVAAGRIDGLHPDEPAPVRPGPRDDEPQDLQEPDEPRGPRPDPEPEDPDTDLETPPAPEPIVVTPPVARWNDPCGPDNIEWVVPRVQGVRWALGDDGHIVWTTDRGYTFANGRRTAYSPPLPADSGVLCDTPEVPNDPQSPEGDWAPLYAALSLDQARAEEVCREEEGFPETDPVGYDYCVAYYAVAPVEPTEAPAAEPTQTP